MNNIVTGNYNIDIDYSFNKYKNIITYILFYSKKDT